MKNKMNFRVIALNDGPFGASWKEELVFLARSAEAHVLVASVRIPAQEIVWKLGLKKKYLGKFQINMKDKAKAM